MGKEIRGWSDHAVAGRRVEVFEPAVRAEAPQTVLWLHGLDEDSARGRPAFEQAWDDANLRVIAPQGGQGWWLDLPLPDTSPLLNPFQFLLESVVPWIGEQWGVQPPAIGVGGIGMGGQGAVNLGFRRARLFPVVAAIAPDIDFHQWHGRGLPLDRMFDSAEAARQQTAILHLHPLNWPRHLLLVCDPADAACFDGTERLVSKLASSGIPFESDLTTTAGGHAWSYFDRIIPRVAKFLSEQLRGDS